MEDEKKVTIYHKGIIPSWFMFRLFIGIALFFMPRNFTATLNVEKDTP